MKKKEAFSLVIALGAITIIFSMSLVSLFIVNKNSDLNRALLSDTVSNNAAMSGLYEAMGPILDDADEHFIHILDPNSGAVKAGQVTYLYWDADFTVSVRDNNDGDDDTTVSQDKGIIVTATATLPNLGTTSIEVYLQHVLVDRPTQGGGLSSWNNNYRPDL